jgi:GNAT superfamily N-acetyltransferase
MNVVLRDATAADSAFVFETVRQAMGPYVELFRGWNHAQELERHADRWRRQRHRIVVADGTNAGYVSTALYEQSADHPASLYLHQLMIRPPFQSRGIGSVCLALVQAEARALGLPLRLRVLRVNPRALAFYLAHGCVVVGESESHLSVAWSGDDRRK